MQNPDQLAINESVPVDLSRPIKILIADDHRLIREGISYILSIHPDFRVVGEAGDGLEAIEVSRLTNPDVILMDLQMPKLNGVETIRQLLVEDRQLKIIILTTFDNDEYIYEGIRAGAQGYLLKDVPKEELCKAIRLVYQGQSLSQPNITARLIKLVAQGGPNPTEITPLSERELAVLRLVAQGDRNKEIAAKLGISENTVKGHVATIIQKCQVKDRTHAAIYAMQKGLIKKD